MIESILFTNLLSVMTKDKAENLSASIYRCTIPFNDITYDVIYNLSKNKSLQITLVDGKEFIIHRQALITNKEIKTVKYVKSNSETDNVIITLDTVPNEIQIDDQKEVTFKVPNQELIDEYFKDNLDYMLSKEDAIECGYLFKIPLTGNYLEYFKNISNTVRVSFVQDHNLVTLGSSQVIDNYLYTNNFTKSFHTINVFKFMIFTETKSKTNNLKTNIRRNISQIENSVISKINNYEALIKINDLVERILNYPDLIDPELI